MKRLRGGALLFLFALLLPTVTADEKGNLFTNPSFEMGREPYHFSKCDTTEASCRVDGADARDGEYSAHVTIGRVVDWGAQFGQSMQAGQKGKTYTFAVSAKAVGKPVQVDLQIERSGKPYDRAARTKPFTLTTDAWTELHVSFTVEKDFPEGWFAYISCTEPNVQYRVDMFRLYEGEYVPYKAPARRRRRRRVAVWDTVIPSDGALSSEALSSRAGWTSVPTDDTAHELKGDAVLRNSKLAVVLRRGATGAEIHAHGAETWTRRAVLRPASDAPVTLSAVRITENGRQQVAAEADFTTPDGQRLGMRYTLRFGQVFVKTEPIGATERLRVDAPCRFAVIPDFFADDMVIDPRTLPASRADLPADNFLLQMLGKGDAILLTVWPSTGQDVRVHLSGQGEQRRILAGEFAYGKEKAVWVTVLEGKGIWHTRDIAQSDRDKILPLDWQPPFPAQWRVDWRRENGLTDSWEMIVQRPDGKFAKQGWFGGGSTLPPDRKRWTSVLNRFRYPCWIDKSGRAYLQPLKKGLTFEGPAVIYPINRDKKTPLVRYTLVDIVRETLGVGPCQYILDVESQKTTYKGRATCATRDTLNPIYKAGKQKQEREKIEEALVDVLVFVKYIRGRIEDYVAWSHEMLTYLEKQKTAHPALAPFIDEMQGLARAIDASVAKRKDKIKTPAYVADLCDKFRKELMGYEGKDAFERCKKITAAFVEVGGNQDALVGECRVAAKRLRQRASLAVATDPKVAPIAREIRRRTQQIMRNPASYEAPRH